MSAKWRRAKAWDAQHLVGPLRPVRMVLTAFSSISLAVVVLSLVVVYATLASVPIGLLARVPTYLIDLLFMLVTVGVVTASGLWLAKRLLAGRPGGVRALVLVPWALVLIAGSATAWAVWVWPSLAYDEATGDGFMLFADFVQQHASTTLRRLPAFEMTEPEFYAWWPLKVLLFVFVLNMVVATIRRIEFRFANLGVLTVHTGIVLIALGSVYYTRSKHEGETLLRAGPPTATGAMTPGPAERIYYDAERVALHVRPEGGRWLQLPMAGVPRYNSYGLMVGTERSARTRFGEPDPNLDDGGRTLDRAVAAPPASSPIGDLRFRLVGYCPYVQDQPLTDWLEVDPASLTNIRGDLRLSPLRAIELVRPAMDGAAGDRLSFSFLPSLATDRLAEHQELAIEYTIGMDGARWSALTEPVPEGTTHALVVRIARDGADPVGLVVPVARVERDGSGSLVSSPITEPIAVGETGYSITLLALEPQPTLAIVTPGYEKAQSSLAKIRISTPQGETYDRWVYHRFPEITQEFVAGQTADGRPTRRDPSPGIDVQYLDLSKFQFYLNERASADGSGPVDLLVRQPGGAMKLIEGIAPGATAEDTLGSLAIALGERWANAQRFDRPLPMPTIDQDIKQLGTHEEAMLAVEVTSERLPKWRQIVWLRFAKFLNAGGVPEGVVTVPDGRRVSLAFGRQWHEFPGFALRMHDFHLVEYAHRGAPRDYQSTVEVIPTGGDDAFEAYTDVVRLNAPLRAPYDSRHDASAAPVRLVNRLVSGLNPNEFKLSQAGWDPQTWNQTQALVDRGALETPSVRFTILHVGNNPGIHVIALGGILMGVGIPWAFYVKPWLVKRASRAIQKQRVAGQMPSGAVGAEL